jgi:hypothetical protein
MDLPITVVSSRSDDLLISVDGAWGQPGLNLSHWPGNTTPRALRHDLSTGIALAFSRLPHEERAALARGCTAIANNHYDTDGVCAVFAVARPDLALPRAARLLATAAAGDFFQVPDDHAFRLETVISNLADAQRSPWRDRLAGLDAQAKHTWLLREIVERMPAMLDSDLGDLGDLWRPEAEDLTSDLASLSAAARSEVVHLDLCVWEGLPSTPFDPGRHALFGSTRADRVLVIGHPGAGSTFRLLLSTLSWFDLCSRRPLPRPDLAGLALHLNEAEGTDPTAPVAWRSQDTRSPSPELWFGTLDVEEFSERSPALRESRLTTAIVRRAVGDALRASWTFPEDPVGIWPP